MLGGTSLRGLIEAASPSNGVAELVPRDPAATAVHSKAHNSAQFNPFSMISIEFKAEFRRATFWLVNNAVAHRLSLVFIDSLRGIIRNRPKSFVIEEHRPKSKKIVRNRRKSSESGRKQRTSRDIIENQ